MRLPGWSQRFAGFVIVTVIGHYIWPVSKSLGEAATAEWINHQIAEKFGLVSPTRTQVIDYIVSWVVPALVVILAYLVFLWGRWSERRRLSTRQVQPPIELTADHDLVTVAPGTAASSQLVKIVFGEDGQFVSKKGDGIYKVKKTLSCEVGNNDPSETLSNCKLEITNIDPEFGAGSWILRDGFELSEGERIFVPVAKYSEANSPSNYHDNVIEICMPSGTPINKIPLLQTTLRNMLTIRATGTKISFYETKLELWIDESGQLRIKDCSASSPRDSSPEEISLFDAATQAYGQTRGTVISEAAERDFDNPLRWYVSYFIAVSKTPLYGNVRFSPKREKLILSDTIPRSRALK